MASKKLGKTQRSFLHAMIGHRGHWHDGCGWLWDNNSETLRLLASLVKRGLVEHFEPNADRGGLRRVPVYNVTKAGLETDKREYNPYKD